MHRITTLLLSLLMLGPLAAGARTVKCGAKELTLTEPEADAMEFLYRSMPLSDQLMYSPEYHLENTRLALRARAELPWGDSVPQDLWQYFVLPARANNEYLDAFRPTYYEELKRRVQGLSMYDAALEVNHWLHEKATYQPSDPRTSAPMATIKTSTGRCGEESVLGVAAFRAVGIPARQVYTPRWAHTDDNHAWVEVWTDGRWHFLGACEPEPELDRAWFNAPASRGLLMHTNVFGSYPGPEQIISRTGGITKINVTANYVPVRDAVVTVVTPDGTPVPDIDVEYKIYNYGEFFTGARRRTDALGQCSLQTGLGNMLAWAASGSRFGFALVDSDSTRLVLNHTTGERFDVDLDIVPPAEHPIPSHATEADIRACKARFDAENAQRALYTDTFFGGKLCPVTADSVRAIFGTVDVIPYLEKAKGNWREILAFLQSAPTQRLNDAITILQNISDKDLRDAPAVVLTDALACTPPRSQMPGISEELYAKYILNPRIANELLAPWRRPLSSVHLTARQAIDKVNHEVVVEDQANAYRVPITPDAVWRSRRADSHSRDIYFVALCRASGIPAVIDPVTGACQYHNGNVWVNVDFDATTAAEVPTGTLRATYEPSTYLADPEYYRHFTISAIEDGMPRLFEFGEDMGESFSTILKKGTELPQGYYLLCSGTRQASGAVSAHLCFFDVDKEKETEVPLVMRHNPEAVEVIGSIDPEALYLPEKATQPSSILSTTGRGYFLIGILGDTDEPSNHAATELAAMTDMLKQWDRPALLIGKRRAMLASVPNLSWGSDPDGSVRRMLSTAIPTAPAADGVETELPTLPVIMVADSFGRVVFATHGYDTTLAARLASVLPQLAN